jgi:hypothetical protein
MIDTGLKISLELNEKGEKLHLFELSWIMTEHPDVDFSKNVVAEMTQIIENYISDKQERND